MEGGEGGRWWKVLLVGVGVWKDIFIIGGWFFGGGCYGRWMWMGGVGLLARKVGFGGVGRGKGLRYQILRVIVGWDLVLGME